jgi:hypothetical protein
MAPVIASSLHNLPLTVDKSLQAAFEMLLYKNALRLNKCLHCGHKAEIRHKYTFPNLYNEFHCIKAQCTHCGIETADYYGLSGVITSDRLVGVVNCIDSVVKIWNKGSKGNTAAKKDCSSSVIVSKPPGNKQLKSKAAKGVGMTKTTKKSAKKAVKKTAKKATKAIKCTKKCAKKATKKTAKCAKAKCCCAKKTAKKAS